MRHAFTILLVLTITCRATALFAADAALFSAALESIQTRDLQNHVNMLAADALEGREAGSRGGKAAGAYLVQQLKKLGLQPAGTENSFYQFFGADYRNVLGLLPGSDPELRKEYVIVSAHYDHVGYGNQRNSFGPYGYIHNGADDNASGTSGLLEVIEAIRLIEPLPHRSLLFAFWDAEEKGLLGSEHWLGNPTLPPNRVKLVINADMIGRLRNGTVTVFGARTAPGLRRLLAENNSGLDLRLVFDRTIQNDSDHYPFIRQRIPAVMLHTGKHADYHRPSDDVDKLNLAGMQQMTRLIFRTAFAAADAAQLPPFRPQAFREANEAAPSSRSGAKPEPLRLGVTWDPDPAEEGIVRIKSVTPESPADEAGLKPGDRVLRFAGYDIDGEYPFGAVVLVAPNSTEVVVQRQGDEQPRTLAVELGGAPLRVGITWREDDAEPDCVILTTVASSSPAASAGLKPDDRIYAVNGQRFAGRDELLRLVSAADTELRLDVERHGRIQTKELRLLPKTR